MREVREIAKLVKEMRGETSLMFNNLFLIIDSVSSRSLLRIAITVVALVLLNLLFTYVILYPSMKVDYVDVVGIYLLWLLPLILSFKLIRRNLRRG